MVPPPLRRLTSAKRRRTVSTVCLILGLGLVGGGIAGDWLATDAATAHAVDDRQLQTFEIARSLWHTLPVDDLFPTTVHDPAGGPGGAARTWRRIGVAPDTDCVSAKPFDPLLAKELASVGCRRLLRATYTDATATSVTTVGLLVARADEPGMLALKRHWTNRGLAGRTDLMPRALPFRGTASSSFGDRQRATWTVDVRTAVPFVVFAVSGFADGRAITQPLPVSATIKRGATSIPAEAGLGYDAKSLQDLVSDRLDRAADQQWRRAHPDAAPRAGALTSTSVSILSDSEATQRTGKGGA